MVKYFDPCLTMLTLAIVSFWTANVAAESVCYPDVGCFNSTLKCNSIKPQSPSEVDTKFWLYTPENPSKPEIIDYRDDDSITNSNFRANRETKFIIHGFISNAMLWEFLKMKNSLLSIGDYNVIFVNWEHGADIKGSDIFHLLHRLHFTNPGGLIDTVFDYISTWVPSYSEARQNTRLVGRQIGQLSRKLHDLTGASFDSMHLIGHSLGAQVAGFAGEYLSGQYGRITGLDPAGPQFEEFSEWPDCLLDRSDAIFVDIIHTSKSFGNEKITGHQDFYPRGGVNQAGCFPFLLGIVCNHLRAVDYFIESITSECSWRAYPCYSWRDFEEGLCNDCGENGCPRMGYYAEPSPATGMFVLGTNKGKPFCREDSGQPSAEK